MDIFNPAQLYLPRSKYNGYWFIPTSDDKYLHSDLKVRFSTLNIDTGEFTGYFETEEAALAAIEEYNYWG